MLFAFRLVRLLLLMEISLIVNKVLCALWIQLDCFTGFMVSFFRCLKELSDLKATASNSMLLHLSSILHCLSCFQCIFIEQLVVEQFAYGDGVAIFDWIFKSSPYILHDLYWVLLSRLCNDWSLGHHGDNPTLWLWSNWKFQDMFVCLCRFYWLIHCIKITQFFKSQNIQQGHQ